ncbi:MAG: HAD family hydrolase [Salibacteraceae bacterium]
MPLDPRIKNVIFDLGGVILDIDFQRAVQAFQQLGISNFHQLYSQFKQSDVFDGLEKDRVSPREFYNTLQSHLPADVCMEQMEIAWNSLILEYPEANIRLLEQLQKAGHYRLFLLSNTNRIHFDCYNRQLQERFGYPNLGHLLEKEYYSFELGMRKPDLEIYQAVQTDAGLIPEETLFIDDTAPNLPPAQSLGWQTHHLTAESPLSSLFPEYF